MRWFVIILALLLSGCATKKSYSDRILRDSVYLTRDSVVIRYVRDSVSERKETGIERKGDTVYVRTERIIERWRFQTDTLNVDRAQAVSHEDKARKETVTENPSSVRHTVTYFIIGFTLLSITIFLLRFFHRF